MYSQYPFLTLSIIIQFKFMRICLETSKFAFAVGAIAADAAAIKMSVLSAEYSIKWATMHWQTTHSKCSPHKLL